MQRPVQIPEFRHPKLQQLADAVRQLARIDGGPGVAVNSSPFGTTISTGRVSAARTPADRFAVLTKQPGGTDLFMTVRPVRYRWVQEDNATPAGEGAADVTPYIWEGLDFEVLPDFGREPLDYASFFWDPIQGQPALDTPFLRVVQHRGRWVAILPSSDGATGWFVVRGIPSLTAEFLEVQRAIPTDTDPWDGLYRAVGDLELVMTMPHSLGSHFVPFVTDENPLTRRSAILPAFKNAGLWSVLPVGRHATIKLADNIQITDCIGPMTGGGA